MSYVFSLISDYSSYLTLWISAQEAKSPMAVTSVSGRSRGGVWEGHAPLPQPLILGKKINAEGRKADRGTHTVKKKTAFP